MSNVVAGPGDDNCVDDEDTLVGRIEERQRNRAAEEVFRWWKAELVCLDNRDAVFFSSGRWKENKNKLEVNG